MPEQHEELRLALVMNGGVSLAVWMGGVTNEIFRVVTQQHPVYAALLELTRTTARVDVISGTSAGGVNGAALGLALLYGGDFSKLREVWLKTGAFGSLLRPPLGENPGSLLMGEEFFLPQIIKAFESLAQEQRPIFKPDEMPIDLRLTTTLLRGQQGHSVDDLGTHIHDVDYRGQFRFRHMNQQQDFGNRDQIIAELARAARSTASFPFAFEPSPVKGMRERLLDSQDNPLDADPPVAGEPEVTRYVVDGGVLNNKPFRGALRSIFGMPAQRGVRRVLAYINPDPGDGPPGKPVKEPPPLSSVLGASLFGIPQSQSIADQLADIQDHNDGVRARRNSVVATVLALSPATLDALPAQLFAIYRQRRLTSTFDGFVYDELPAASRRRSREPLSAIVGRRGRDHLLATFLDVNWDGWIPTAWPLEPSFDVCCRDVDWEWGLYPVEFAIKVMLDLLRRTQQLCDFEAPMQVPPAYEASGKIQILREPDWTDTPNPPAVDEPDSQGLMKMMKDRVDNVARAIGLREGKHISWDREHVRSATKPQDESHRKWLVEAWSDAYRCVRLSERFRDRERVTWRENADELLDILARKTPDASSGVDLVTEEDFRRLFAFLVTPRRRARCGLLARHVAMVLNAMSEPALALAAQVEGKLDLREHDREAARQVRQVFEWFLRDGPGTPECRVLRRLMQLEVIEYAHNDHEDLQADTLIELAQISGNAVSPLGGPAEAKEKLLGLQLAHFGAFYRQSWRANDWTYGRLDGSVRLVKILLNPDRLQRFFNGALPAMLRIKAIALDDIVSPVLKAEVTKLWVAQKYAPRILQELAFLGNAKVAVPDALPVCTEVITLRLHFGILREEIDPLLAAIAVDRSQGADALGPSDAFVQRFAAGMDANGGRTLPFSPEQAHQALKAGLIGGESLVEEAGSDLFTRTLAHTTATVQGVLASKSAKLGPVSLFFAGLRLPVLGFYFVVRGLTRQSRTSAALHGAILAIGLALVFVQLLLQAETKPTSLPPSLVTFGWALLAYGLLFSIVSSPRIVGPLIALVAMAAGVYLVSIQLIIAVAVVFLLWLSVNYRYLAIVQWLLGMATVPMAALWTKGWNGELPPPGTLHEPVYRMALLVCLILLLATWQASTLSRAAEAGLRRMRKWFLGPKG